MEPSEQERATEWVTPAEVMAKINAVSRQPVREGSRDQRGGAASSLREGLGPLSPKSRLRPYSPESQAPGGLCRKAVLREKTHTRACNPVHACHHALLRMGCILTPQGNWGSPKEKKSKEGNGRTLNRQDISAVQTFGLCQR